MADNNTIARPYAQALFAVAQENDALDAASSALATGKSLMASGEVAAFLARPELDDARRLAFVEQLFAAAAGDDCIFAGGDRHGTNFLRLLLEHNRIAALPEMAEQFEALKADIENSVDAVITSATPLGEAQQREMAGALGKTLGREVRVTTAVDASLLGGAVIRTGDVVIDGSLRARLDGLANALTAS